MNCGCSRVNSGCPRVNIRSSRMVKTLAREHTATPDARFRIPQSGVITLPAGSPGRRSDQNTPIVEPRTSRCHHWMTSRVEPGCLRVEPGCPCVDSGCPRVELGCSRVEPGCSRVEPGCSRVEPGCSRVEPGCSRVEPGCSRVEPGCPRRAPRARGAGRSRMTATAFVIPSVSRGTWVGGGRAAHANSQRAAPRPGPSTRRSG